MENDYRVMNIVSMEMDRDSAESTLSNSSGLTVHNSRGDADSKLDVWTNEKHNSYLDYLENSFVTQLYSLLGGDAQRLSRARDVHKSTDQFTVLQNGCWQKVNFGKKRARLEKDSSQSNPASPNGDALCSEETKHSGDKACTRTSMSNSYPAQGSAEASGQNFREEELEKGCDSEVTRKRKRGANYDDSSLKDDQVVP
ncbi:hypothetical protein AALP_AA7G208000 [Arabis alpina]|uniref:Uncharacterized protein n=1 Tax=Arabis alpina TaxID=50452 RepID=A0A087GJH2_ARAAL|nr:hypothetical protein AALP_AA7G208000 [Arabis alpina]